MTHTTECIDATAAYKRFVEEFEAKRPNYCRNCGGWGYLTSAGCSVPYGMGSVNLPDESEPCAECSEKGICPHCGEEALDEDMEECSACGWTIDCEGLSEPPECLCRMDSEDES